MRVRLCPRVFILRTQSLSDRGPNFVGFVHLAPHLTLSRKFAPGSQRIIGLDMKVKQYGSNLTPTCLSRETTGCAAKRATGVWLPAWRMPQKSGGNPEPQPARSCGTGNAEPRRAAEGQSVTKLPPRVAGFRYEVSESR